MYDSLLKTSIVFVYLFENRSSIIRWETKLFVIAFKVFYNEFISFFQGFDVG